MLLTEDCFYHIGRKMYSTALRH